MSDSVCAVWRSALLRSGVGALLAAWSVAGASQTTFKCLDARGRVTYSNVACATQGLTDGGPVADRTTTIPMAVPKKAQPPGAGKAAPTIDPEIGPLPSPAQGKPVSPQIEKLLK